MFQIPYYVGPLGQEYKDKKGYNVWAERKEPGKIYPWNFEEKIFGKKVYIGKIILKSIQIAFLSSLTIELLQLFLRLGTFQISDLFFNTMGGLAGGIIYFLVNAVAERIRRIRN